MLSIDLIFLLFSFWFDEVDCFDELEDVFCLLVLISVAFEEFFSTDCDSEGLSDGSLTVVVCDCCNMEVFDDSRKLFNNSKIPAIVIRQSKTIKPLLSPLEK